MPKTKEKEKEDENKSGEIEFEEFDPDSEQIRIPISEEDETKRIEEVLGIPLGEGIIPEEGVVEVREEREQKQTEQANYSPEPAYQEGPSYGESTESGTTYDHNQYQIPGAGSNVSQGGLEGLVPTVGASKDEAEKQQRTYIEKETGRTDIDRDLLDREHWRESRKKKPRV